MALVALLLLVVIFVCISWYWRSTGAPRFARNGSTHRKTRRQLYATACAFARRGRLHARLRSAVRGRDRRRSPREGSCATTAARPSGICGGRCVPETTRSSGRSTKSPRRSSPVRMRSVLSRWPNGSARARHTSGWRATPRRDDAPFRNRGAGDRSRRAGAARPGTRTRAARLGAVDIFDVRHRSRAVIGALYEVLLATGVPLRRFQHPLGLLDAGVGTLVISRYAGDPVGRRARSPRCGGAEAIRRRGRTSGGARHRFRRSRRRRARRRRSSTPANAYGAVALARNRYTAGVSRCRRAGRGRLSVRPAATACRCSPTHGGSSPSRILMGKVKSSRSPRRRSSATRRCATTTTLRSPTTPPRGTAPSRSTNTSTDTTTTSASGKCCRNPCAPHSGSSALSSCSD